MNAWSNWFRWLRYLPFNVIFAHPKFGNYVSQNSGISGLIKIRNFGIPELQSLHIINTIMHAKKVAAAQILLHSHLITFPRRGRKWNNPWWGNDCFMQSHKPTFTYLLVVGSDVPAQCSVRRTDRGTGFLYQCCSPFIDLSPAAKVNLRQSIRQPRI